MSELTCEQLVELVTDYLEEALTPEARRRFERHTALCPGCDVYLDQIRITIAELGRLTPERVAPDARDRLLAAFRGWAAETR
ncbi:anti-sigma factor family protein [Nocardioides cynanchi]|uniref:anti-sigma factor family protein n=1 Tax=Nocardioides cynanchi TaxID=2558918 RepID=UPI001244C479|nr:zf-HC2 domain-containing protein [Nocardioides cynanchi]